MGNGKLKINDVSHLGEDDFKAWHDSLFSYQKIVHENINQPLRNILKSRQIGATYYFAMEAFERAVLTGENQYFLASCKGQAEIFKNYLLDQAKEYFGIKLSGKFIKLETKFGTAEIGFLHPKMLVAGKNGNVYIDEYMWSGNFVALHYMAMSIAFLKKHSRTYLSSLNYSNEEALRFWGVHHHTDAKQFRHEGYLCNDRQWRYAIPITDIIDDGFNLLNIKALKAELTEEEFTNLFMCGYSE